MILIPAAGEGRRFREAGYTEPKHLIPLLGKPMIERVVDNVRPLDPDAPVLVATQGLVGKTRGAIETILKSTVLFGGYSPHPYDGNERLVLANCDQLLNLPEHPRVYGNGVIYTFRSANPAHSYVKVDRQGLILGITEKPTQPHPTWRAVSGVYVFTQAEPFIDCCRIVYERTEFGEQYVSAALARMIDEGFKLYAEDAPTAILGTPEDFQRFETAAEIARTL